MQRSFWIHYTYAVSVLEENYLLPCSAVFVWFTLTSLQQFLLIEIIFLMDTSADDTNLGRTVDLPHGRKAQQKRSG